MSSARWQRLLGSRAPDATILIRVATGVVFLSEGIQKFLYPDALGVGRFAKIGIPAPEVTAPFVGVVETVGGVLLLAGLLTRLAALSLAIDMVVAIASTKVPILIGGGYFLFAKPSLPKTGFWSMLHEARTDFSMLLCTTFLFIVGAGSRSLDSMLLRAKSRPEAS
jgi:putative oxidoreductase